MKKSLTRIGAALAATAVLSVGATALLAPAASAAVVRPVAETASVSSNASEMEFRAMAGTTSAEASYYDSKTTVAGLGKLTAPAGTTIESVSMNSPSPNPFTISGDKKTAVAERSTWYGGASMTVKVRLAFAAGLAPNAYTATAGSFVVTNAGSTVLTVPIRAFVLAPSAIPSVTGKAVPGGSTAELLLYDATTSVTGTMTITAPNQTTIASVRDNLGGTFAISSDRRTATGSTTQWGEARATAAVSLAVDRAATPGTTLSGGSVKVANNTTGTIVASGSIGVDVQWPTALLTPKPGSILETDQIFTGVGTPGATVELRDAAGSVVASTTVAPDGSWSAALLSPLPEGESALTLVSDRKTVPLGSFVSVSTATVDTPVIDPAIAGGAALALIAVAGTVLALRHRSAHRPD